MPDGFAEDWGKFERRSRDVAGDIFSKYGADVYVWWDGDKDRFRCSWRHKELSMQVNMLDGEFVKTARDRMVTAWADEIKAELLKK